jgi:hypothetical protein
MVKKRPQIRAGPRPITPQLIAFLSIQDVARFTLQQSNVTPRPELSRTPD